MLALGVGIAGWRIGSDGDTKTAPVDEELAGRIRATGVATYLVSLDDARMVEVRVESGTVRLDYERDGFPFYSLTMRTAPESDLCRAAGYGADGNSPDGGSCTSDGDRFTTAFEEMGTVGLRKAGTLVVIANLTTEGDPGIQERAFAALENAQPITAEELARPR